MSSTYCLLAPSVGSTGVGTSRRSISSAVSSVSTYILVAASWSSIGSNTFSNFALERLTLPPDCIIIVLSDTKVEEERVKSPTLIEVKPRISGVVSPSVKLVEPRVKSTLLVVITALEDPSKVATPLMTPCNSISLAVSNCVANAIVLLFSNPVICPN